MMTSPHTTNILGAAKPDRKNGTHSSSTYRRNSPSATRPQPKDPVGIIKCPRCDSPNTKFCYYNNYSLTQPRHFCKTCRRYWTKGGALRSVPIGGGCRKNKKLIKSSSSSSSAAADYTKDNSGISSSHDHVGGGGLKFFKGLSPAMDFQFDYGINTPRPNTGFFSQISSFSCLSAISSNPNPGFSVDPTSGFDCPLPSSSRKENGGDLLSGFQEMGPMVNPVNYSSNLASSIESLSFINQDLHWKLQQQRLGMLFVGDNNCDNQKQKNSSTPLSAATTDEPISHNLLPQAKANTAESFAVIGTSSRKDGGNGDLSTELFFDNNNINNSYATLVGPTPETSSNNNSNWSGFQAWTELTQYASLP
ncbi:hypothetical protein OROGR_019103 [Orobanche gracilis]